MKREMAELQQKNEDLSIDLQNMKEEAQPKRGRKAGTTNKALQKQVADLKRQVRELEKVGLKYRRHFMFSEQFEPLRLNRLA